MNFLAPLFLAGAAAIALPVMFHLIRRSTRQRTVFSSLLLLQPSPLRLRRRSRLEDLLLLALRCLALGLLALGFARPFLRSPTFSPPAANPAQRVALLVDGSASMQRAGLWDAAVVRAEYHARALGPGDQASLVVFGRETQVGVSFDAWNATAPDQRAALVVARLRETGAGWSAAPLGGSLVSAAEALAERTDDSPSLVRRIVLISDLQEGARLDQLQAYDWPKGIGVQVDRVEPTARRGNTGLQLLADAAPTAGASNATVRVRVTSSADAANDRLEVGWGRPEGDGFLGAPQQVSVPPGGNRVLALVVPDDARVDRILLRGDAENFDNTVFVLPPAATGARLVHVGEDPGTDPKQPLFFLRRAFPGTNRVGVSIVRRTPAEGLSPDDLHSPLLIATSALPPDAVDALRGAAERGGTVLWVLRSADAPNAATFGRLLGHDPVALEEVQPRNYAMLADLDFRHPLLAAFADPRFSDFTKIRFWRHRRFDATTLPGARVIARFDSGDPAWLEVPVGRGRIFVFAAGWHPEDSQLAVSTKFVPLLYALTESSGAPIGQAPRAYTVDEALPVPAAAGGAGGSLQVLPPTGAPIPLAAGTTNFAATDRPGIYTVRQPDAGEAAQRFAVNLDPAESRTFPMAVDDLERLGVSLRDAAFKPAPTAERAAELAAAEVENRQKLWRWFLIGTVAILLLESFLAGWIARRVVLQPAPA